MKNLHRTVALAALLSGCLAIGPVTVSVHASRVPGVTLPALDPAMVDDILESSNAATRANVTFSNQSTGPVDIYWIDYNGHRMLYKAALAVNGTWTAGTFLTHPWLVVATGTGGTTASDTGMRIAGFVALTSHGDTAIIK